MVRQQTFPAGKPVTVEHRYHTSVGMSFDTVLRGGLRGKKALEPEVARYKADYCIADDFLKSIPSACSTNSCASSASLPPSRRPSGGRANTRPMTRTTWKTYSGR